ncbi:hypothetical protein VNO78_11140 [Psophocarpus tetragonolobus]|uniref:Uncharacterized protein n=1 Tax=Psophocarpus tetragonolobus TaxID=3891 RepID=A0AAN9SSK4_PSOTE
MCKGSRNIVSKVSSHPNSYGELYEISIGTGEVRDVPKEWSSRAHSDRSGASNNVSKAAIIQRLVKMEARDKMRAALSR